VYGGVAEPEARARDRQARIQTSEVGREESIAGRPGSTCYGSVAPGVPGPLWEWVWLLAYMRYQSDSQADS
jgi:hypothetical protein